MKREVVRIFYLDRNTQYVDLRDYEALVQELESLKAKLAEKAPEPRRPMNPIEEVLMNALKK